MKYSAKLVDITPSDPGLYYPTFEYVNEHGQTERVTGTHAIVVRPWDLTKKHTIRVAPNGQVTMVGKCKNFTALFFVMLIGVLILLATKFTNLIGLIFIACSMIPICIYSKGAGKRRKQKKRAKELTPMQGKIVWYREVTYRHDDHTDTYHFPVVEYQYQGKTWTMPLPDSEEPNNVGAKQEFYLDVEREDVFSENTLKSGGGFLAIIACFVFIIFFCWIGLVMLLPKEIVLQVFDKIASSGSQFVNNPGALFSNIAPYLFGCFGLLFAVLFAVPMIQELRQLLTIKNAQKNGQTIHAVCTKTNDYGRSDVRIYEYHYMGERHTYQTEQSLPNNIELYIHPKTGQAYSKGDVTASWIKVGIFGGFLLLMAGSIAISFLRH